MTNMTQIGATTCISKKSFIFTPTIYSHISNNHHHHQIYKQLDSMSQILSSFSNNFTYNITWHREDYEFHIDFLTDFSTEKAWHQFYRRLGYLQGRLFNGSWVMIDKEDRGDLEFMETFCKS